MDEELKDLPPAIQAFFEHISPPKGQGKDSFKLNLTILLAFVPYVMFLLVLIQRPFINWVLLSYSVLLVVFQMIMIHSFKKSMGFVSNPFDFVAVQLFNFVLCTISLGLSFYFLWKTDSFAYHGPNSTFSVLDMVYYSFITVATVGYGDIIPVSPIAKILSIIEVIFGFWFVVTIIPVAVADQAEKIRHYRVTKEKLMEEIKKGLKNGELRMVDPKDKKNK